MVVLVTCKNKEDPIKHEDARVATSLYVDFSNAQGQMVQSGRNSNSSKLLCMSLLPARMKKIQFKMKSLEWPQDFSKYKFMGTFRDAQVQQTPQYAIRSGRI